MNRAAELFVHILFFQCPSCGNPMSSAITKGERNLGETDARSFVLRCDCGWTGTQIGLLAKGTGWKYGSDLCIFTYVLNLRPIRPTQARHART
jgi:hypothetical protein